MARGEWVEFGQPTLNDRANRFLVARRSPCKYFPRGPAKVSEPLIACSPTRKPAAYRVLAPDFSKTVSVGGDAHSAEKFRSVTDSCRGTKHQSQGEISAGPGAAVNRWTAAENHMVGTGPLWRRPAAQRWPGAGSHRAFSHAASRFDRCSASSEILTSVQDFHLPSSEHLFYFHNMRLKLFSSPKVNSAKFRPSLLHGFDRFGQFWTVRGVGIFVHRGRKSNYLGRIVFVLHRVSDDRV